MRMRTFFLSASGTLLFVSSVRDYVQNPRLSKGWSWHEVECRSRPKPCCGGPHHDREKA